MKLGDFSALSATFSAHGTKPQAWRTHVYVEWFVVLFVAAVMLAGIALWSSYVYGVTIDRLGDQGGATSESTVLSVDKEALTATLEHFSRKKEEFTSLKNAAPTYRDPSL